MFSRTRSKFRRHKRQPKTVPGRRGQPSSPRFEQLEPRTMLSTNPTLSIPTTTVGARSSVVAVPIMVDRLTDNASGSFAANINVFGNTVGAGLFGATLSNLVYVNCT